MYFPFFYIFTFLCHSSAADGSHAPPGQVGLDSVLEAGRWRGRFPTLIWVSNLLVMVNWPGHPSPPSTTDVQHRPSKVLRGAEETCLLSRGENASPKNDVDLGSPSQSGSWHLNDKRRLGLSLSFDL